ncbi:hypothetical protein [Deinococcus fonticola]|uniref:hypothetical protein n=1 Tax=Deinococcus fonticola TaxID=2528713 RepID=UPI00107517F5|nr:hypothetical protein [Deinococcus fonticola]
MIAEASVDLPEDTRDLPTRVIGLWGPQGWEIMRRWPLSWIEAALGEGYLIWQARDRLSRIDDLTVTKDIGTGTKSKKPQTEESDISTEPFSEERLRLLRIVDPVGTELGLRIQEIKKARGFDAELDAIPAAQIDWSLVEGVQDDSGRERSAAEDRQAGSEGDSATEHPADPDGE